MPVEVAEKARAAARGEAEADCLLSVGGGSTTGTAKAAALETDLPIVAVPTTYAGSEIPPSTVSPAGSASEPANHRRCCPKSLFTIPS